MEALTRTRRTSPLRSLQNEVNQLFESVFPPSTGQGEEPAAAVWSPRMDLMETDDKFHLQVDLPGIEKGDVSITVDDNRLSIRGERHEENRMEGKNAVRMERSFGTFYRSLRLPKTVKADSIEASFKNGVLTVDIPKTEKSKPKKIQIT